MKIRLDVCMVNRGMTASREKAREKIISGNVSVNGAVVSKPGTMIPDDAEIAVTGDDGDFVGRGGRKLEKLLSLYKPSLEGLRCIDVGASTGGFTEAMLRRGASKVYAVDVGTDQLADTLRADPRVVVMEHTDIRTVTADQIGGTVDFAGIDVSFISLTMIMPCVANLLTPGAEIGCLIKPQFEAGRSHVGKKGVVKDPKVHAEVLRRVLEAAQAVGLHAMQLTDSPIRGQNGNIEYLLYAVYEPETESAAPDTAANAELPEASQPSKRLAEQRRNHITAIDAERTVHEAFLHHR
ncbi:MAG: TlyA family RNA methyltransferase [Lachnospiraceae bacterium]|nr:TlyA family RNA methyltransferase [Lachnospiraceae bacterium]